MKCLAILASMLFAASSIASHTVVLPERFATSRVVVENSPQFKELAIKNKALSAQLSKEKRDRQEFENRVGKELRAKDDELQKLRTTQSVSHQGIFGTIFGVIGLAFQFISNPFTFLVRRAVMIVAALVVGTLLMIGYRRWRNRIKK